MYLPVACLNSWIGSCGHRALTILNFILSFKQEIKGT